MNTNYARPLAATALAILLAAFPHVAADAGPREPDEAPLPPPVALESLEGRAIDLAICLDTSGSMSNLIESAKQHVWSIVNELALAKPQPRLRVALLSYGNDGHSAEEGWVRVETGLTEDLDRVSERLFALRTNGGTELVGRVLSRADAELDWSTDAEALKLVVVAGNESADQDKEVRFADACASLIGRDVLVNALYCGAATSTDAAGWSDVARRADGRYFAIDTTRAPTYVETPFDDRLTRLSSDLNRTYIPFGAAGAAGCANQAAQDANAVGMNRANSAARAQTKAGSNYWCSWDLIDVIARDAEFDLAAVPDDELPEAMRGMDAEERSAHVAQMAKERARLKKAVGELSKQRADHIAAQARKSAAAGQQTFETALLTAIREQAGARGFRFGVQ